jgi:Cu(I)/Ag(I) efflux system membrane fusion protein
MQRIPKAFTAVGFIGLSFAVGYWAHRPASSVRSAQSVRPLYYQDPMHPAYKSDKPGIAPDCGMDLEPVYVDSKDSELPHALPPGAVRLSTEKESLIGLHTEKVFAGTTAHAIRVVGKVAVDETQVSRVSALVDGVVRKVSPYTAGSLVKKDDLLATYFVSSRDLYNAMQAFFLSAGTFDQTATTLRNKGLVNGAKADARVEEELLKSYGVTSTQIREMVRTHEITRDIDFRAPFSGIVVDRSITPGAVVTKGTELFRIADLSHIWVLADVFENNAEDFKSGILARVEYEGRVYRATVTDVRQFDPNSRTLKVRLEMDNPGIVLRPDMFVRVELHAKERPGLSVPSDSIIDEGLRKVVFVSTERGVYEPRTVTTGTEYDGRVQILTGLQTGDAVVVSGMFLLDSESRLQAVATPQPLPIKNVSDKQTSVVSDPVCGMSLSGNPEYLFVHQSVTYRFCSKTCREKFEKNPAFYTPQTGKSANGAHT